MRLLFVFYLHGLCLILPAQAQSTSLEANATVAATEWSPRNLRRLLQRCFSGAKTWQCLTNEGERLLNAARLDNSTWHVTDYLSVEPEELPIEAQRARKVQGFAEQLLQLMQGRALRLRLPKLSGIANGIDEISSALGGNEGTLAVINDKIEKHFVGFDGFLMQTRPQKSYANTDKSKKNELQKKAKKLKGRKKKDKDKNMAMMGGMIMVATVAQMFLGKVILIAGSAFIMAKIALVISLLGSLKKGSTGHSGKPEVIVANTAHSHESGWHRSMPPQEEAKAEAHAGHEQAYYGHEIEMNRRLQQTRAAAAAVPTPGFY